MIGDNPDDNLRSLDNFFKKEKQRPYKSGQIILHQDDPVNHVFYVKKGYVKAYVILESGEQRTVLIVGPGEVFPSTASVVYHAEDEYTLKHHFESITDVVVNMTEALSFQRSLYNDPKLMTHFVSHLSASNRELMEHLEVLESKNAIEKITLVLPYLIKKCGKKLEGRDYSLIPKLVHQDIADLAGLSRETASIHIKQLEQDGILEQRRGRWIIHGAKLARRL